MTADSVGAQQGAPRRYRPPHVSIDQIITFDTYNDPKMTRDPYRTLLAEHGTHRIFWDDVDAGFKKGCWVITQAVDIRRVFGDPKLFCSNNWVNLQGLVGAKWKLIPNGLDGAEHLPFRTLMASFFSPKTLNQLNLKAKQLTNDLLDDLLPAGRCEFIDGFARKLPIAIILDLVGLPRQRMAEFLSWEVAMLKQSDFAIAAAATNSVLTALQELIDQRRAKPEADLTSAMLSSGVMGRPVANDEVLSMLFSVYLGGLDTVATSFGWHFHELASNQPLQDRLRANPAEIPTAIDELLRRYAPTTCRRQATADVEIGGAHIKAGDWISIPTMLGNFDESEFPDPLTVDVDRKNKRHFSFAAGVHFCLGHRLAHLELTSAMTLWLDRAPPFRIEDPDKVVCHGGQAYSIGTLPLTWV